jgi:hypothetical protein
MCNVLQILGKRKPQMMVYNRISLSQKPKKATTRHAQKRARGATVGDMVGVETNKLALYPSFPLSFTRVPRVHAELDICMRRQAHGRVHAHGDENCKTVRGQS